MNKTKFEYLISTKKENRKAIIEKLIDPSKNPRQFILEQNKDYYSGIHWSYTENGTSNTTRSGKKIWGKLVKNTGSVKDPYGRGNTKSFDPELHKGHLQVRNYIKQFIQKYQEFIFGETNEPFKIVAKEATDGEVLPFDQVEINRLLKEFWFDRSDILSLVKTILAKGVISTIMPLKLKYSEKESAHIAETFDPMDFFPIYDGNEVIGAINAYYIDADIARNQYGLDINEKEGSVCYAKIYVSLKGDYYMATMVNGDFIKVEGESYTKAVFKDSLVKLVDELAFIPYYFQANLDNAISNFDDTTLEDSEIFGWIDKNDALNANETMAFVAILLYIFPSKVIDFEKAAHTGIDPSSPEFKQALRNYMPSMFSVNDLPLVTEAGNAVDQSFYNQLDRIKLSLFEEAGIPEFLVNSNGLSQVSERTVALAMSGLIKKITQKRDALSRLFQEVSRDVLQLNGIKLSKNDILVQWPDIITESKIDTINTLLTAAQNGVLPVRYVQRKILEISGNEEDIEEVKELSQSEVSEAIFAVNQARNQVAAEDEARRQIEAQANTESELQEAESRINQIQS